jgi:homoserine dehydrogenase
MDRTGVAGGIPVIKAIREGLAANKIERVSGIINGTGNFILTEMREKGRAFGDVLQEAQELGYAEADPTFDVEGVDAAHKLVILASIAFGMPLCFDQVFMEGITKITAEDVAYAEELGYRIKHLGVAKRTDTGVELRVHPAMIDQKQILANVDGVLNAVHVLGDAVGPTLYSGAGAGAEPTASAVIADIVDLARTLTADPDHRVPHLGFHSDALSDITVLPIEDTVCAHYLRLNALDKPGVLSKIAQILSDAGVSIEALIQKDQGDSSDHVPVIMLTNKVREGDLITAINAIAALDTVVGTVMHIRVADLG